MCHPLHVPQRGSVKRCLQRVGSPYIRPVQCISYRQIALSSLIYNPHTKAWALFQLQVLPFGAVESVHSFLRLARAIWWIGVVACKLMWSSFFDDDIVFWTPGLRRSSELTASALFRLLGWAFAEDGRKCVPLAKSCEALGVIFDLSLSAEGGKGLHHSEAHKLRGRMQFADAQIYGRTGRRCTKALRDYALCQLQKGQDSPL